jgi:murein DD-endopeptidase MepM/ murein hydrolase activator NlpD
MKLLRPLPGDITRLRVNKTLHGRSKYRKKDVPGHNVVKGYNSPGTGDGVDLFVSSGLPVTAMHAGKITRIADRTEKLSCLYIEGKVDGHEVISIYAHVSIKGDLVEGCHVEAGRVLGYVGNKVSDPHLHLELWIDGKAVCATTARGLSKAIAKYF